MAVQAATLAPDLQAEMKSFIGRHTDKQFDWDAFPGNTGFPELDRAQIRYIGAGGSPKVSDPNTMKPEHFTLSMVHQPPGKYAAAHSHEIEESFLVLDGVLTIGWAWEDEVIEVRLGYKDMCLNANGRPHGFRNDGVDPVLMSIMVASGNPLPPRYVTHPRTHDSALSRRFGAEPGKVHQLSLDSSDPRHREMAHHVVRYRDRTPVWDPAGFARMNYIGGDGTPAYHYRSDLVHLPKGQGVRVYEREVEDAYLVVEGVLTVGWEENGLLVEQQLGPRDVIFNPKGRLHSFRNNGVEDAQFLMVVGEPRTETVAFKAA